MADIRRTAGQRNTHDVPWQQQDGRNKHSATSNTQQWNNRQQLQAVVRILSLRGIDEPSTAMCGCDGPTDLGWRQSGKRRCGPLEVAH